MKCYQFALPHSDVKKGIELALFIDPKQQWAILHIKFKVKLTYNALKFCINDKDQPEMVNNNTQCVNQIWSYQAAPAAVKISKSVKILLTSQLISIKTICYQVQGHINVWALKL